MAKINIKGAIVSNDHKDIYDFFGMDATSPNDVLTALDKAKSGDVEIHISSGGGDIWAGSEIYTALKEYEGNVTVKILGLAASAASVIAMAGDKVMMSPTAELMIHNVWTQSTGDFRDMEHAAKVLETSNKTVANAYVLKTGRSMDELLNLMNDETWFDAKAAKEYGFVDEIMFDDGISLAANVNRSAMLPPEVIQKIRNMERPAFSDKENNSEVLMARLHLLKLGGKEIE